MNSVSQNTPRPHKMTKSCHCTIVSLLLIKHTCVQFHTDYFSYWSPGVIVQYFIAKSLPFMSCIAIHVLCWILSCFWQKSFIFKLKPAPRLNLTWTKCDSKASIIHFFFLYELPVFHQTWPKVWFWFHLTKTQDSNCWSNDIWWSSDAVFRVLLSGRDFFVCEILHVVMKWCVVVEFNPPNHLTAIAMPVHAITCNSNPTLMIPSPQTIIL